MPELHYHCDRCGTKRTVDTEDPPDTSFDARRSYRVDYAKAIRERHAVVGALVDAGWTHRKIAKELRMSERSVANDLS